MKNLVILGAGTAGTIVANRMRGRLGDDWRVTVVEPHAFHVYQAGLLFLALGRNEPRHLQRPREGTLAQGVEWVRAAVDGLDPGLKRISLEGGGSLDYDLLVIASGADVHPDRTPGLLGDGWRVRVFDFYTVHGALELRDALRRFDRGRIVVNPVAVPIKGPTAPLEFLFLLDELLARRGVRTRCELVLASPGQGAFTRPGADRCLLELLEKRGIRLEPAFETARVDGVARRLEPRQGGSLGFDLLVTIPAHRGAAFLERSGLADPRGFVPTDPHTLAALHLEDVFVLGDATDLPAPKAGSVAHYQAELLAANLERVVAGLPPEPTFDGHASCFVETGHGKALLLDFNYQTEPLPGRYPTGAGPFTLLGESRANHWGKLAFRWLYWHGLLPAHPLPVPARMSMAGKRPARALAG